MVLRLLSSHGRGRKPCPLCEDVDLDGLHVLEHVNRLSIGGIDALDKLIAGDIQFVYTGP